MHYLSPLVLSVESTQPATGRTSLRGLNRFSSCERKRERQRNHKNQTENTKRRRIMAPLSSPDLTFISMTMKYQTVLGWNLDEISPPEFTQSAVESLCWRDCRGKKGTETHESSRDFGGWIDGGETEGLRDFWIASVLGW